MLSSFRYAMIRFVRSYFQPMDPKVAQVWYRRMKILYAFCAFQFLGYAFYSHQAQKRSDEAYSIDESHTEKMIRILGPQKTKVITLSRKGITEEYTVDADEIRRRYDEKKQELYNKYSV